MTPWKRIPSPADEYALAYNYRAAVCNVLYDPFAQHGEARHARLAAVERVSRMLTERDLRIPELDASGQFMNPRYLDEIAERLFESGVWKRSDTGTALIGSANSPENRLPRGIPASWMQPVLLARHLSQYVQQQLSEPQRQDLRRSAIAPKDSDVRWEAGCLRYDVLLAAWRTVTSEPLDLENPAHPRMCSEAWRLAQAANYNWSTIL